MGIASLVLGIISIVIALFMSYVGWFGSLLAIIGIILAVVGKKRNPEKKGICTAGLVLSIIGLILGFLFYLACVACLKATSEALDSAASSLASSK